MPYHHQLSKLAGINHDIGCEYVRKKLGSVGAVVRGVNQLLRRRSRLGSAGGSEKYGGTAKQQGYRQCFHFRPSRPPFGVHNSASCVG